MFKSDMVEEKTIEDFRKTGLLWFINTTLHGFGWAIVVTESRDYSSPRMFPARVKFRGFDEKTIDEGYSKVTQYLHENGQELAEEVSEVVE